MSEHRGLVMGKVTGAGKYSSCILGPIVPYPFVQADKIIDVPMTQSGLPTQEPEADEPTVVEG